MAPPLKPRPELEPIDEAALMARLDAMQHALDAATRRLERAERLSTLGMLCAMLAHEFNNLLTPIRTSAQLALRDPTDDAAVGRALKWAAEGSARGGRIAESILELAGGPGLQRGGGERRSAERSGTPRRSIAVGAEVKACVEAALWCSGLDPGPEGGAARHGVTIHVELENGLRARIGSTALEQVLINLLSNARRVLKQWGGERTISIRSNGDQTNINTSITNIYNNGNNPSFDRVVIEVQDSGPGIAHELREVLFDPFCSGLDSEDDGAGSGLGLAICRRLVEDAGGTIELVEWGTAGGALFRITLASA
ncbi:MAG: HAMP domain-containing sensor histidine kinase [Phycisphaerales bacterium]|jgi:signal transduction histidine kinase|nr:HAMP domain-containing sensor histidine kinase [Phycisphaerales bacterium]